MKIAQSVSVAYSAIPCVRNDVGAYARALVTHFLKHMKPQLRVKDAYDPDARAMC